MTWREYRILKYLIEIMDEEHSCCTSFNKLIEVCRIGKQQAIKSIDLLISNKIIAVKKGSGKKSNCYMVDIDKAELTLQECMEQGLHEHKDIQPHRYNIG